MLPHQISDMLSITFSSAASSVGTVKNAVNIRSERMVEVKYGETYCETPRK